MEISHMLSTAFTYMVFPVWFPQAAMVFFVIHLGCYLLHEYEHQKKCIAKENSELIGPS